MTEHWRFQFRIQGPDREQVTIAAERETVIGRQGKGEWQLQHEMVSRRHALLECAGDVCRITDLRSANGTLVNGVRLEPGVPRELQPGDEVVIKPFKLTYEPVAKAVEEAVVVEPAPFAEAPAVTPAKTPQRKQPPAPPPLEPPASVPDFGNGHRPELPPGLSYEHSQYLAYLPGIYHIPFMARFLALFESILGPIEWTVDNFDLILSPQTAPAGFLSWFERLFALSLDGTWSIEQRRTLLNEAAELFEARGTRWALSRLLEIYLGCPVQIDDQDEELEPFTFSITLPVGEDGIDEPLLQQLVDAHKPAHTSYYLRYRRSFDN